MLSNISWSAYLTFIAVSALTYYLFVLLVYYRKDFLQIVAKNRLPNGDHMNFNHATPGESLLPASASYFEPKSVNPVVQSFMDEVKAYLEEAKEDGVFKEVLLNCLRLIAGKYLSIEQREDKKALHAFIIHEVEMKCAVFLSEAEVNGLWSET